MLIFIFSSIFTKPYEIGSYAINHFASEEIKA